MKLPNDPVLQRAHVARYIADYQAAKWPAQPQWLSRAREAALASFERLGFPTTKLEQWRFTSVAPIADNDFAPAADGMPKADPRLTVCAEAPGSRWRFRSTVASRPRCLRSTRCRGRAGAEPGGRARIESSPG